MQDIDAGQKQTTCNGSSERVALLVKQNGRLLHDASEHLKILCTAQFNVAELVWLNIDIGMCVSWMD